MEIFRCTGWVSIPLTVISFRAICFVMWDAVLTDTAYSVETLDAVPPLVIQENEIIYLLGQDLPEKTQMACIDT